HLTDPAPRSATDTVNRALRALPQVFLVLGPDLTGAYSQDGRTGFTQVQYRVPPGELGAADREALLKVPRAGREAGLKVEITGSALTEIPTTGRNEILGIGMALVVLSVTFGSAVAAVLPIVTALAGVLLGLWGITVATGFVDLSSTTPIIALMLGLAVGIDYTLLILSRYRHEIDQGCSAQRAAARATSTAGGTVVLAGATVVVALGGLSVIGIPVLTAMGVAAACTVALAVAIAITLLPALLGLARGRVLSSGNRRFQTRDLTTDRSNSVTLGLRWVLFVIRHRGPVLIVSVLLLGLASIPAASLRLGLPDAASAPVSSTQRQAYDMVTQGFGVGRNGSLMVVVDTPGRERALPVALGLASELERMDGAAAVAPPVVNSDGDTAVIMVTPETAPRSPGTRELVTRIRDQTDRSGDRAGARVRVTGGAAADSDVASRLTAALPIYLGVISLLALLLLMVVLRSVLVPVVAVAGFLLSVGATLGAVVAVFQWGWLSEFLGVEQPLPVVSILPTLLVGILFGLAMDYQVFLVARMLEERRHGCSPVDCVVAGFRHSARVVTAAALIMAGIFAGFVANDDLTIKSIGFALAFGVLVDALVVRMTIVPAVLAMAGSACWWFPHRLERLLSTARAAA
ncbi:MAG: putative drug exporter of the superfamily, partial [Actinomycetota bacterium]|nr:putative drug exporter of the superfamily [Actinomycetota bacterium]